MNDAEMENIRPASASAGKLAESDEAPSSVVLGAAAADGVSLQDAFAKFREQKKSERRLLKACRTPGNRSQEFKDQLREKFIAQAHTYLGIPYHEKYREEGSEVEPLYLDCCGLVRKCVLDLKEDFGFLIGRWNQAYQMDTLPQVLTFEQLRPGDLIFYEGAFTSKRSKTQKHNNVHVEIFLGGETGEGTIGARFQKGVVSLFPSYKFVSKSWDLVAHHFRSLDTWLDGLCVSHCHEHPWISESGSLYAAAGRKSIFNDEEQGDEAAGEYSDCDEGSEAGGGDGDSVDAAAEGGSGGVAEECIVVEAVAVASEMVLCGESEQKAVQPCSSEAAGAQSVTASTSRREPAPVPKRSSASPSRAGGGSGKLPPRVRKSEVQSSGDLAVEAAAGSMKRSLSRAADKEKRDMIEGKPLPKTYYVHKSNGWKLVCASLDKRGWQQLPFEYNMSTRFSLKWVERRSQIDYKSHVAGQMVNHIINNDVFTTKLGLVNCLRDFFCRTFHLASSATPCAASSSSAKSSAGGSKKVPVAPSAGRISFDDMILTGTPRLPTPWLMETYQLDQAIDCAEVLKDDEEAETLDTPDSTHLWIYKPSAGNRGRGVQVIRGGRELKELVASYVNHYHPTLISTDTFKGVAQFLNQPPEAPASASGAEDASPSMEDDGACFGKIPRAIIQRYCINPLLVEGYKFDIRCYMLVARTDPHYLAFYHPGYCRFTLMPYSYDPASAGDTFIHLTNASVQKKHPSYQDRKDKQVMSVDAVIDLLMAAGDVESAEYMRHQMNVDMMTCMVDVLKAAKVRLQRKSGYFDLFGFDFMLRDKNRASGLPPPAAGKGRVHLRNDNSRQLLLIETNTNPALHIDCDAQANLLPFVVDGALELVLASNVPSDKNGECAGVRSRTQYHTDLPSRFQLIYDEESGFEFGKTDKAPPTQTEAPPAPPIGRSVSPSKKIP